MLTGFVPRITGMDQDTIGRLADATKAAAETGDHAIEAARSFGRVIKGPIGDLMGMVQDRVRFARWNDNSRLQIRLTRS